MSNRILARLFLLASLFITVIFTALPTHANKEELLPKADFAELRQINSSKVLQIIDPFTIQLDDKRVIRLSGIDFPDYNPNAPGPLSTMAVKILRDLLEGNTVNVYQTMGADWGRSNRMGQQLAHLELQKGGVWVQGTLITLGLARVMTDDRTPEMSGQMYMLEQIARAEKNGMWGLDKYKVHAANETDGLAGHVAVVQGKVVSTAMRQNNIYINFGNDWKRDFTITILPQNRRKFFDNNIDPLKWNGKVIRVRGYVGEYNGPFIEVTHPEQIEISPLDAALN